MSRLSVSLTQTANDIFSFGPWVLEKILAPKITVSYYDLEEINRRMLEGRGDDICKVSFHILPEILDEYVVLPVGATIVKDKGPIIVGKKRHHDLSRQSLVVPGKNTTAYLLVQSLLPQFKKVQEVVYSKVISSVLNDHFDCGLLIHENAFEVQENGLQELENLQSLWSKKTRDLPLPLGGVVARRSLGDQLIFEIIASLDRSLSYSLNHPFEMEEYIMGLGRQKDLDLIRRGIDIWVNDETRRISPKGREAIGALFKMACDTMGIAKNYKKLFA